MTVEETTNKRKINNFILEKKKQIIDCQYKKIDGEKIFFHLWWNFNIRRMGGDSRSAEKKKEYISKDFHTDHPSITRMRALMRNFVVFLVKYEQVNRRKCKTQPSMCDSSKGTTSEIYPVTKDGQILVKAAHRFCRSNDLIEVTVSRNGL